VDRSLARLLRRTFGRRWRWDAAVVSAASYLTTQRRAFPERCGMGVATRPAHSTRWSSKASGHIATTARRSPYGRTLGPPRAGVSLIPRGRPCHGRISCWRLAGFPCDRDLERRPAPYRLSCYSQLQPVVA
jgi:hypothetical protein